MNNTIEYATGRTYNKPQVLTITIEARSTDEYGIDTVTATFKDEARQIAGRVNALLFNDGIGAAVLAEYDAGRYQLI
jgi:threonine aldolase